MIVCNESRISGPESESECFRTRSLVHTHDAQFFPLILHKALLVCFFFHIITEASNVLDLCEYKTRYNNRILTTCFSSAPCAGLNFQ